MITLLPITSHCSADAAPSKTSQSCPDKQGESGGYLICLKTTPLYTFSGAVITPTTISDGTSSSDESDGEFVPLPLPATIPRKCLPYIIDVYDDDTFRTINNKDEWDDKKVDILKKFLARRPIPFVRIFPVRILTTLGNILIPATSSSSMCQIPRISEQASSISGSSKNLATVTTRMFSLPHSHSRPGRGQLRTKLLSR